MSLTLEGWGSAAAPLTQGYGHHSAAALVLRELFTVPVPDGSQARRAPGCLGAAQLGRSEAGIAFGLSFAAWLGTGELLSTLTATAWASPARAQSGQDVSGALLQATRTLGGTTALVLLHGAQPQTAYVVSCLVQTTAGRTLACRMPPIWCPD